MKQRVDQIIDDNQSQTNSCQTKKNHENNNYKYKYKVKFPFQKIENI